MRRFSLLDGLRDTIGCGFFWVFELLGWKEFCRGSAIMPNALFFSFSGEACLKQAYNLLVT